MQLVRDRGHRGVTLNIEIKRDPTKPELTPPARTYVGALITTLYTYSFQERVTIQSFDWEGARDREGAGPAHSALVPHRAAQELRHDRVGEGRIDVDRRLQVRGLRLGAEDGARRGRIDLVAELQRPGRGEGEGSQGAQPRGDAVDRERSRGGEKLKAWGVDGVITDRPDLVRASMK
jgi:glycerophosphoryl diester phosphodiesterase